MALSGELSVRRWAATDLFGKARPAPRSAPPATSRTFPMQTGIFLAFLAYFVFACGDAALKALGPSLPVYEIGFFVSLFAFLPALFTKRPEDSWADTFRVSNPGLMALRMAFGAGGTIAGIIAFTSLPLAEAYALIFLLPIFVTVFSRIFLKEAIGWKRWSAVVVGLLGTLLVVRPGFQAILPGHFAAIACAACGAGTVLVLRRIGASERRITIIGAVLVASAALNGVLMLGDFKMPGTDTWWLLVFAGLCSGLGHTGLVFATRLASAASVAPTQYSQIVWATVLGAAFFAEYPDAIALGGMTLVGLSGLFTFVRERKKTPWPKRTPLVRNR